MRKRKGRVQLLETFQPSRTAAANAHAVCVALKTRVSRAAGRSCSRAIAAPRFRSRISVALLRGEFWKSGAPPSSFFSGPFRDQPPLPPRARLHESKRHVGEEGKERELKRDY